MKENKTNVMRILEQKHIAYVVHEYQNDGNPVDGITVAKRIGQDPSLVYKTLVTVGASGNHYVFVIPVVEELNLKKSATAVHEKSLSMIHVKDIMPLTGYVRGGCSPIGMKKQFRTVLNDSVCSIERINVSAGRIGSQIEISVSDLIGLLNAEVANVVV